MMWNVVLFYGGLFLFLVAVTLLLFYLQKPTAEASEDTSAEATAEQEALAQIQTLNKILTEPYKKALKSFEDSGNAVEAMNADCKLLFKDIPGVTNLIPLPLSENLVDLPADLDKSLTTTILYLSTKTSQMLKDIEDALACKEKFEGTVTLTPEEKAKCCGTPMESVTPEEKAQIQYSRITLLKTVMNQEAIQKALVTISSNFAKLQDIEKKTQDGSLKPNCATAS